MSNKNRNPFKMRASEKIEADSNFLKLFSSEALDILIEKEGNGDLWGHVLLLRSSPGAGKTSLLRIFEPGPLGTVFNQRFTDHRELYSILKKLKVVSEERVETLGVLVKCTRNYEILEDLGIDPALKLRLFYSLLNARMILAALQAILELKRLNYPEHLDRISFDYHNKDNYLRNLVTPCNGRELFEWASSVEKGVYEALDSFLPIEGRNIEAHDELFSLAILTQENLKIDKNEFCGQILFMIDDAHKLSPKQRSSLLKYVIDHRSNTSVWIAERLEAQLGEEPGEIKGFTSYAVRDYAEVTLEKFWSENKKKFEKVLYKVADKRASLSTEDVDTFQENLANDLEEIEWKTKIEKSIENSLSSIGKIVTYSPKYSNWLDFLNETNTGFYQKALLAKQVEIFIARDMAKEQLTLAFPLDSKDLVEKLDTSSEAAAKLFVAREQRIPYYYGFDCLVSLSTNNIEQFLGFAAPLFEAMLANYLAAGKGTVEPKWQDKIVREVAEKKWKELSTILPESRAALRLLGNLGQYFFEITYKLTASYPPGINGFAIYPSKRSAKLFEEPEWEENERFSIVQEVIKICVAFNLLEERETKQGEIGQKWKVYYLNRWICVRYDLPITYGNWHKISPGQLLKWIKE